MGNIKREDVEAGRIDFGDIGTGRRTAYPVPGAMLKEILDELGVTPYRLAKAAGIDKSRVSRIIAGERAITADTSIRLGRALGQSAHFWLNLQTAYDIAVANAANEYEKIEKLAEVS